MSDKGEMAQGRSRVLGNGAIVWFVHEHDVEVRCKIVWIVPLGAAKGAQGEVGATGEDALRSWGVPICGGAADFFVREAGSVEVRVKFSVCHSPLAVTRVGEHGGVCCPRSFSDGVATLEG